MAGRPEEAEDQTRGPAQCPLEVARMRRTGRGTPSSAVASPIARSQPPSNRSYLIFISILMQCTQPILSTP